MPAIFKRFWKLTYNYPPFAKILIQSIFKDSIRIFCVILQNFNPSALGIRILGTKVVCKIDQGNGGKVEVKVHWGKKKNGKSDIKQTSLRAGKTAANYRRKEKKKENEHNGNNFCSNSKA